MREIKRGNVKIIFRVTQLLLLLVSSICYSHSSDPIYASFEAPGYWGEMPHFSEGLGKIKQGKGIAFIDKKGKVMLQWADADVVGSFHEGLCTVGYGANFGYIDRSGKMVIKGKFDTGEAFHDGLAAVSDSDGWFYIDKTGKQVGEGRHHLAFSFTGGYGFVSGHGFSTAGIDPQLVDQKGKTVLKGWWQLYEFSEGLAFGSDGGNGTFLVDKTLKKVPLPFEIDEVEPFSEGIAPVCSNHKGYFIDRKGKVVVALGEVLPGKLVNGLAPAYFIKKGSWGFIDSKGKVVIEPSYEMAQEFSCGLAAVCVGSKWGFVDRTGKVIIPIKYHEVGIYSSDVVSVETNDHEYAYLDLNGKPIWEGHEIAWGLGAGDR